MECQMLHSPVMVNLSEWRTAMDEWKTSMDEKILKLQQRIWTLEENKLTQEAKKSEAVTYSQNAWSEVLISEGSRAVDSFAAADYDGIGCIPTFLIIVRTKRWAWIQLLLLLACIIGFMYYGAVTFEMADRNELSEFKPERKSFVIDYVDESYEMPYIWLRFYTTISNANVSDTNLQDFVDELLLSQDYFNNSVLLWYETTSEASFIDVVTSAYAWPGAQQGTSVGFWGFFRLELSDPVAALGEWKLIILFDVNAMALGGEVSFEHLVVTINREENVTDDNRGVTLQWVAVDDDEKVDLFLFRYSEIVTKLHNNGKVHDFEISGWSQATPEIDFLSSYYLINANSGDIVLNIASSPKIEHWEEYVAFGYTDWITGMGGLLTLITAMFFWVSYLIAILFGDRISMGILPGLSFNFASYEHVNWLVARLRMTKEV